MNAVVVGRAGTVALTALWLLSACDTESATDSSTQQATALETATPSDDGTPDGDVPAFWSVNDRLCTDMGVFDIDLASVPPDELAELASAPGFATSLDELVREVLAEGTSLGRRPLDPEYAEDFDRALPQGSEYSEEAAEVSDDETYTDEALQSDPELREDLILESEEPDQELTTTMIDIREAASQASAQRELLEAWNDGTATVEEDTTTILISAAAVTMTVQHVDGLYGLAGFTRPADCYEDQISG